MAVTPTPGVNSSVATGGTPVVVAAPGPAGGFLVNPAMASDQGLSNVETLYVNPVGNATLQGNGTTFALQPGQSWAFIPGQTTPTTVNAESDGHKFSVVVTVPA